MSQVLVCQPAAGAADARELPEHGLPTAASGHPRLLPNLQSVHDRRTGKVLGNISNASAGGLHHLVNQAVVRLAGRD